MKDKNILAERAQPLVPDSSGGQADSHPFVLHALLSTPRSWLHTLL